MTILGVFMMWCAVFLRESEEGRIQNTLEELWVRVDDRRQLADRRHVGVFGMAAILLTWFADMFFGQRLVSVRAVGVAACIALLSMFGTMAVAAPLEDDWFFIVSAVTSCVVAVLLPIRLSRAAFLPLAVAIILTGVVLWPPPTDRYTFFMAATTLVALLFASACAVASAAILRQALKKIVIDSRIRTVFLLALVVTAAAILLILIPGRIMAWLQDLAIKNVVPDGKGKFVLELGDELMLLFTLVATNAAVLLLLCAFVLTCLTLVAHRLMWPIVERPVYALQRYGVFNHRRTLFACGLLLLSFGSPGAERFVREQLARLNLL